MQIPYRLTRRLRPEPATALLLLTADPAELLHLCSRLGLDPLPDIFATRDGFLLLLGSVTTKSWPHTVRLRQMAEFLLLPADADLEPQLHSEEAEALTRDRGLVFLPGGRVLEFEPDAPLGMTALLQTATVRREEWHLPAPRRLAESIRSITLDLPDSTPDELIEAGGEDIGTESPRPDGAGLGRTAVNRARMNLGQFLSNLGRALGLSGLSRAGRRMVDRATEAVPRLSERLYGAQEAALRDLLKMFQNGEVDRALRRAIPKAEPGDAVGRSYGGTALPDNDPRYSLAGLLGRRSRGLADIWEGHDETFAALYREYRKAAEQAANRGDFRRAAYIYGKLLAEWRAAADMLARGGLHRDAAILYRDKLGDYPQAAIAFEAAGEFDEALRLFDRLMLYEKSGDLLRRLGEEDAAMERYIRAAEAMVQSGHGPLRAGEFILNKTGRRDLAESYFDAGWSLRNVSTQLGDAVPCGINLARFYAERDSPAKFLELLSESEAFFATPGNASVAGQMFNTFAQLSDRPLFDHCRDEVRDRCLQRLAAKMREHAQSQSRPGTIVSNLLGTGGVWEAPVVRDATFALQRAMKEPRRSERAEGPVTFLHLATGTITAARIAPHSGEVFAGFDNGQIVGFRPSSTRILHIGPAHGPVATLATTLGGDMIVASTSPRSEAIDATARLESFVRHGNNTFDRVGQAILHGPADTGLAPLIVPQGMENLVLVRHGPAPDDLSVYRGGDLIAVSTSDQDLSDDWPIDLPLPKEVTGCRGNAVLVMQKGEVSLCLLRISTRVERVLLPGARVDWTPHLPVGSTLSKAPASWHQHSPGRVEVAGLNEENAIYWIDLHLGPEGVRAERILATSCREGYRAVKLVRSGMLVGLTAQNRLVWLRASGDRLSEWAPPQRLTSLSSAIACFFSLPTNELIVLLANGYLVRVPVPA